MTITEDMQAALASEHVTYNPPTVSPDTSAFRPGGQITVQVTCTVSLAGLALLHVPAPRPSPPIDIHRGRASGFSSSEGSSGANPSTGVRDEPIRVLGFAVRGLRAAVGGRGRGGEFPD
jgi:hypothetical protein